MLESIKKISNPLTIIAIFAGLAEISGTAVLPLLQDQSQFLYVWFLMGFPSLLIVLFFVTLNFNHKVLYAPSDFRDEDNFLKLFAKPTPEERLSKLSDEIEDGASEPTPVAASNGVEQHDFKYREVIRRNATSTHYFAQELVVTKLAKEFDEVDKEVMLRSGKSQFLFDAIAKKGKRVYAIEVKYFKDRDSLKNVRSSVVKIQRTLSELPLEASGPMTVILAIATECPPEQLSAFEQDIRRAIQNVTYPIEVRMFNLTELEKELLGN